MAIILEFSLPVGAFALEDVLETVPSTEIELDQLVPTRERTLPFLWAEGDDLDAFERLSRDSQSVEDITLVEAVNERRLYEIQWNGRVETVTDGIVEADGTVLSASASAPRWEFTLRFPGRRHAKTFQSHCIEREIPINLSKLYDLSTSGARKQYGLTEKQCATLRLAYDRGYFYEPREADLADLGDELGISPRAVSYRLRRGVSKLVEHTIDT